MKANLVNPREHGKAWQMDKDLKAYYATVVATPNGMRTVARLYINATRSGGTVYATLYAVNHADMIYVRGSGKATGGGFHLPSAALDTAIFEAGFELLDDGMHRISIDSAGDEAMEKALVAVTRAMGYYDGEVMVVKS